MNILIDTHTLHWLLTNDPKIKEKTKDCFRRAEKVFVPTIVLLELLYTMRKKGLEGEFPITLDQLKNEGRFIFVSLDLNVVEVLIDMAKELEMHDRIIVSTAKVLNLPIITKDPQIQRVYKNTIW